MQQEPTTVTADTQHVTIWERESRITASFCHTRPANCRRRPKHPPKRSDGDIKQFSPASRHRLYTIMRRLRSRLLSPPIMATLTYHNVWPSDPHGDLHAWLQWLRRRTQGHVRYLWRLEWQQRGAPHYHVMIWLPHSWTWGRDQQAQQAITTSWATIIGTRHDSAAMKHGVHVTQLNSMKRTMIYVAKYLAKDHHGQERGNGQRRWGRSMNVPTTPLVTMDMDDQAHLDLRRIARRLLRSRGIPRHRARAMTLRPVYTLCLEARTMMRLIHFLYAGYAPPHAEPPPGPLPLDLSHDEPHEF